MVRKKEPRTRLDVDERRAQLLALGLERFGKQPYDDVSIDDIAKAAGISKGLLYHYFPTKKAFYAATVRDAAKKLLALCDIQSDAPPLEQLAQGIDAYLDFVREHRAAYTTLMRSGVGVDREIAAIVDDGREKFLALLTEGIVQALPTHAGPERPPLFGLALRGWVGMAEQASLAWLEALAKGSGRAPPQSQVRDLLVKALIAIVADLGS